MLIALEASKAAGSAISPNATPSSALTWLSDWRCEPGMICTQEFSTVASSMAIQAETLTGGSMGQKLMSWCQGISAPPGGLSQKLVAQTTRSGPDQAGDAIDDGGMGRQVEDNRLVHVA